MEPDTTSRPVRFLIDLINRIACTFGDHTWSWKHRRGEVINREIPARATCRYCGKRKGNNK